MYVCMYVYTHTHTHTCVCVCVYGLPWWLRQSACNAGDQVPSLSQEDLLEKKTAILIPVFLSGELHGQIPVKRRELKGKGEKERYSHLNAEFQRIASRDKKAFLSDQCKEREENNRMAKTRDLFKTARDTKGIFNVKMGTLNDRNGIDPTEAKDIKKRWQEYTEKLYKKGLHDPDNHDGVITHLEPNILECEVKWALGSITTKLVEVNGIPVVLF